MSSGTQVELDWTGTDAGEGGAAVVPARAPNGARSDAGMYLTDEEILGLEPIGATTTSRRDVIPSEARNLSSIDEVGDTGAQRDSSGRDRPRNDKGSEGEHSRLGENALPSRNDNAKINAAGQSSSGQMPAWMQTLAGDPKHGAEAQQLWQEHQAFRAAFASPDEARAIKELFPGGAQEARTLRQSAQAVDQIDAAIYSGDSRAQSEIVAELARANPAAFRSLFAEAAKVLAGMGQSAPHGVIPNEVRNLSGRFDGVSEQSRRDSSVGPATQALPRNDVREGTASPSSAAADPGQATHTFDPAAYASFERSTNDVVARDVRSTISDTLTRVLPDGVAEGAARRIGDDIFNEVHRALAADRTLSEQVGNVLRDRRFGSNEQQRVASLLAGRAKQLVPSVARRVIGEWTSSVLGTARNKAARQATAASRVDIAAPGGSLDSMPLRAMSPREVNYASMSDDEILGM